jgi:hypothetical protein
MPKFTRLRAGKLLHDRSVASSSVPVIERLLSARSEVR